MTEVLPAPFVQLLGIGVFWISAHCVGMCGPLITALDVPGARGGRRPMSAVGRTLSYQAGRALIYAGWGALAGTLGKAATAVFTTSGAFIAGLLGVFLLGSGLRRLLPARPMPVAPDPGLIQLGRGAVTGWAKLKRQALDLGRALLQAAQGQHPAVLGMFMGFLPCMVTAWALGLAALTGSPAWGALLMVTLVVLTSPMLVGVSLVSVGVLPRLGSWLRRAQPYTTAVAGAWMLLIAAAGAGLIDHAHATFFIGPRHYMVMFW